MIPRSNDGEDRKQIIDTLLASKKKTFGQIRTLLKLSRDCRFNLESDRRTELAGDVTSDLLSDTKCFGEEWRKFPQAKREEIIDLLFKSQDPDQLVEKLVSDYGVTFEHAEEIANVPLPEGYGALSKKAIEKMLPFLEQGMKYSEAAKAAGYHHSDFRTGEVFEHLPYYGEILQNNVIGGSYQPEDRSCLKNTTAKSIIHRYILPLIRPEN